MGQQYSTGPCHVFVGPYNCLPSQAFYLGLAEEAPSIDHQNRSAGARSAMGGVSIPHDSANQGQEGFVSYSLTRLNYTILFAILNQPNPTAALLGTAVHLPGTMVPGDIGTLGMLEQTNITLFLQFPYSAKPAMQAGSPAGAGGPLIPGYRYPNAELVYDNYPRNGTVVMSVDLAWHCMRDFNISAGENAFGAGVYTLFDQNVAGLPLIN
jgi:hypothetical protein